MGLQVGYVYILTNRAIPKLIKIGMTTGDPETRARKLSGTGTPGRWQVYAKVRVPNCGTVEHLVHRDLRKCRHTNDREFFQITPDEALKAIYRIAKENINDHPDWPDPIAAQDILDKQELQQKEEEQEREEQRRLEIEVRRHQAEREKLNAERRRKEESAKELEERRKFIDASTRETLQKGMIGLWTVSACIFFGVLFQKNIYVMLFIITVIAICGILIRNGSKKDAINLREQWNLPSIHEAKVKKEASERILQKKQPSVTQEYITVPLVFGIVAIIGLLWAFSNTRTPTRQDSMPPTLLEPTITPTPINNEKQITDHEQTQQREKQIIEERRQADLARQQEEARILQEKKKKRKEAVKRQRNTKQREAARRQKKFTNQNAATQSPDLNQQPQLAVCKYKRVMSDEDYRACGMEPPRTAPSEVTVIRDGIRHEEAPSRIRVWTHRDGVWTQH